MGKKERRGEEGSGGWKWRIGKGAYWEEERIEEMMRGGVEGEESKFVYKMTIQSHMYALTITDCTNRPHIHVKDQNIYIHACTSRVI